jgi:hypothetical protein
MRWQKTRARTFVGVVLCISGIIPAAMLVVTIVGLPPTYNDFLEYWWPAVSGPITFYSLAGLNLVAFICLLCEEKIFKIIRNSATYKNPERVKSTPEFLKLRQLYDPEKGYISPEAKLSGGTARLRSLCEEAQEGEVESYYLAVELADMLTQLARKYAASGRSFRQYSHQIQKCMEDAHTAFGAPQRQSEIPEPPRKTRPLARPRSR